MVNCTEGAKRMANAETSTAPIIQGGETLSFEHDGRVSELLPIVLLNALLNVLTLSLYRFWGKTRVRRYLWDSTNLLGDRLEYTGTGGELFKGFLFVLFAIFLPIAAAEILITFYFPPDHPIQVVFRLVVGVIFGSLIGVAIYRARRYRLSRTRWRSVRANQSGSSLAYSARYIAFILLTIITLGWVYPVMRMRLMGTMMNNTWFGDRQFHFEGSVGSLYERFAMCWFLFVGLLLTFGGTLEHLSSGFELATNAENIAGAGAAMAAYGVIGSVVLGIVSGIVFCIYKAAELRHFAKCTRFEGLAFELNATIGGLIWLVIGNTLILLLTLGFGVAFTQMRKFRFVCDRLEARGTIDFGAIIQSADQGPGFGEGLADAFDVGAI